MNRKSYSQPEVEIRNYKTAMSNVVMTSDPSINDENDLNKDDEYDYFG